MKTRSFRKILSIRTAKDYIDGKLLKYAWYRKYSAKKSRAAKAEIATKRQDEELDIECYTNTAITPQSEIDREKRIHASRQAHIEEEIREEFQQTERLAAAKKEVDENMEKYVSRIKELTDYYTPKFGEKRAETFAYLDCIDEVAEKLRKNECNAEKS